MNGVSLRFAIAKFHKLDDGRMLIEGTATDESLDSQGDILEYEGSKKAFNDWRGNVREAHDPRKPVGKALEVEFDDTKKAIGVRAFISSGAGDTQAKIQEGVLTSFSVGGGAPTKVEKIKKDGRTVRLVKEWPMSELSVVDAGANPNATFQLVKADGVATEILDEEKNFADNRDNRFRAAILNAIPAAEIEKRKKPSEDDAPDKRVPSAKPKPTSDPAPAKKEDEGDAVDGKKPAEGDEEEPAKCDKCDKVHKEGVEACDKQDLAAADTARAKKGVEEAKAKHKIAQAKEDLAAAKAKHEEIKSGGPLDAEKEAAKKEKAEKALQAEELQKKQFTAEQRKKLAEKGEAMKDGSFPTPTKADWNNAVQALGRAAAGKRPAVKAYLKRRAKALGITELPDSLKVLETMMAKHWGGGEEYDLMDALQIVFGLKSLIAAEAAEGESDQEAPELELLEAACAALYAFIELEAGELNEQGDEGGGEPKAVGGPAVAESMHGMEMAVRPVFLKALDAAIQKRFKAVPVKEAEAEVFTANHGEQLADGIGKGFAASQLPLLKALGDLKAELGEIKAAREKVDVEKALAESPLLKTMGETIEKIAKQPAVLMPARRDGPGALAPAASLAPNEKAEILLKWRDGASPETKLYLERCAQLERQK